jgi:hypothetical protein
MMPLADPVRRWRRSATTSPLGIRSKVDPGKRRRGTHQ